MFRDGAFASKLITMRIAALFAGSLFTLVGCGFSPGKVARPPSSSAMSALGEPISSGTCDRNAKPKELEPLVVDWRSSERADLEVAMRQGVVPVRHECGIVRLVKSCRIAGSYDFAGVSRKSEVIQLASEDELRANLPLSSVQLSAQVQSGATVDLALLLIGKRTTSVADVIRTELEGSCEEVTHFVRAAHVGAFAFTTGEVGHVTAAAEIFKLAGGGADSQSKRKAMHRDGSLEACEKSTPDAERPPSECGAALRVELVPILDHRVPRHVEMAAKGSPDEQPNHTGEASKDAAETPKDHPEGPKAQHATDSKIAALRNPCESGFVWAGGKCVRSGNGPHLCDSADYEDCEAQCTKGSAKSCFNLARILQHGSWEAKPNTARSIELFQRACTAEVAEACSEAFDPYAVDDAKSQRVWLQKGCDAGGARSCLSLGTPTYAASDLKLPTTPDNPDAKATEATPEADEKRFRSLERACTLDATLCETAASYALSGKTRDLNRGAKMLEKACFGQDAPYACETYGGLNTMRKNLVDPSRAVQALAKGCDLGNTGACALLGHAYRVGDLLQKNARKASLFLERSCTRVGTGEGCFALAEFYESGEGGYKAPLLARDLYLQVCRRSFRSNAAIACERFFKLSESTHSAPRDEDESEAHLSACGNAREPSVRSCQWVETHVLPRCAQGREASCNSLLYGVRLPIRRELVFGTLEKACAARVSGACLERERLRREAAGGKKGDDAEARVRGCEAGEASLCAYVKGAKLNPSRAALERACKRSSWTCATLRRYLVAEAKANDVEIRRLDEAVCEQWQHSNASACDPLITSLLAAKERPDELVRASELLRDRVVQMHSADALIDALEKVNPQLAHPIWEELCREGINRSYWSEWGDRRACEGYERTGGTVASLRGKKESRLIKRAAPPLHGVHF